jgi:hypothetical protein
MNQKYFTVEQMIEMIDEPQRGICQKIFSDNRKLFQAVQGASNNHQAWPGGYQDHVQEAMNLAIVFYEKLNSLRPLPFSLSDALLVIFLHDLEKPWKYEVSERGEVRYKESLKTKADHREFRNKKLKEYGITLTEDQENGMKYVEGEHDDYSKERRVMGPLAAFCHLCDVTSARIWFDHPLQENDQWLYAKRIRD